MESDARLERCRHPPRELQCLADEEVEAVRPVQVDPEPLDAAEADIFSLIVAGEVDCQPPKSTPSTTLTVACAGADGPATRVSVKDPSSGNAA